MTATKVVLALLLDAGADDTAATEHIAGHLVRAVEAQGDQTAVAEARVRVLLDAHGIATENHPDTWLLAAAICDAVRKENP